MRTIWSLNTTTLAATNYWDLKNMRGQAIIFVLIISSNMYLVTGDSGFVGRNLMKKINAKGLKSDINNELNDELKGMDGVIHLAAIMDESNKNIWKVNVDGTKNLVSECKRAGVKRLVYISSLNVKLKNRGVYGDSKAEAENIIKQSGLNWTILRPGLVYGKDDTKNLTIIYRIVKKWKIFLTIDKGEFLLTPVLVDDLTEVIRLVLKNKNCFKKIYEVGGEKVKFNELIEEIGLMAGVKKVRLINVSKSWARFIQFILPKFRGLWRLSGNGLVADKNNLEMDIKYNFAKLRDGLRLLGN